MGSGMFGEDDRKAIEVPVLIWKPYLLPQTTSRKQTKLDEEDLGQCTRFAYAS